MFLYVASWPHFPFHLCRTANLGKNKKEMNSRRLIFGGNAYFLNIRHCGDEPQQLVYLHNSLLPKQHQSVDQKIFRCSKMFHWYPSTKKIENTKYIHHQCISTLMLTLHFLYNVYIPLLWYPLTHNTFS